MKNNYTHITIVLDRSGSMGSIKNDTIGGFNTFLEAQQKVPGEATITLIQFDDQYEAIMREKKLADAKPLTSESYQPRGSTALLDAIGKAIDETGTFLSKLPENERAEKIIFVILTDGEENSSREFKKAKINEMITTQKDIYKWEFVFLGANQDAIQEAATLGINAMNAMTYSASSKGMGATMDSLSMNVGAYRSGQAKGVLFSAQQKQEQEDLIKGTNN